MASLAAADDDHGESDAMVNLGTDDFQLDDVDGESDEAKEMANLGTVDFQHDFDGDGGKVKLMLMPMVTINPVNQFDGGQSARRRQRPVVTRMTN